MGPCVRRGDESFCTSLPTSSLRTQGPIPRCALGYTLNGDAFRNHTRLWLWAPEPVIGCAFARPGGSQGRRWILNQQIAEIAPLQILALDQLDLPVPLPALQLLLPRNRLVRPVIRL